VAVLAVSGCRSATLQQGPSDTLRAYAPWTRRADDAYKLCREPANTISVDAFRRMVKENAAEMKDIAHALARPASDPLVTSPWSPGRKLQLVYEDGRWRLDGSPSLRATPQQPVEAFLRFERKRYDVMIRSFPMRMERLDADKPRRSEGSWARDGASRRPASRAAHCAVRRNRRRATMAHGCGRHRAAHPRARRVKIEHFD
jgi:hypothetical protein